MDKTAMKNKSGFVKIYSLRKTSVLLKKAIYSAFGKTQYFIECIRYLDYNV